VRVDWSWAARPHFSSGLVSFPLSSGQFLARLLRPLRVRGAELVRQKQVLAQQVGALEGAHARILAMMQSLCAEFELGPILRPAAPPPRAVFRGPGARTAVITPGGGSEPVF